MQSAQAHPPRLMQVKTPNLSGTGPRLAASISHAELNAGAYSFKGVGHRQSYRNGLTNFPVRRPAARRRQSAQTRRRQLAATDGLGLRNAPAVRHLLQRGAGISVRSRLPGARSGAQSNVPAQAAPRARWRSLLVLIG